MSDQNNFASCTSTHFVLFL